MHVWRGGWRQQGGGRQQVLLDSKSTGFYGCLCLNVWLSVCPLVRACVPISVLCVYEWVCLRVCVGGGRVREGRGEGMNTQREVERKGKGRRFWTAPEQRDWARNEVHITIQSGGTTTMLSQATNFSAVMVVLQLSCDATVLLYTVDFVRQ